MCFLYRLQSGRLGVPPATADEVLIILILLSVYPADVGERGHEAALPPGADEHARILAVRIKLRGGGGGHTTAAFNVCTEVKRCIWKLVWKTRYCISTYKFVRQENERS